jgi:hypothetical protein
MVNLHRSLVAGHRLALSERSVDPELTAGSPEPSGSKGASMFFVGARNLFSLFYFLRILFAFLSTRHSALGTRLRAWPPFYLRPGPLNPPPGGCVMPWARCAA